jgi:hypothetical protein
VTATTELNRPILGEPNAPCRSCGSPLAMDQRYCLQCGTRRAEARLPFLDMLAGAPAAPVTQVAAVEPSRGVLGRMSANATLIAFLGCLLLALGVGVLIGGLGSNDSASSAPPAQVITVGGAVPAAAAPSSAAPSANSDTSTTDTSAGANSSSKKHSGSGTASSSKDSHATNKALKDLNSTSGGDYSKKSAKLPKTVGTGGKAPPVDKSGTKIGGGSEVDSIG